MSQNPTMSVKATRWILVTGQPGCGKTTAVQRMVTVLQQRGFPCKGFYTEEVRQWGERVGFDVITVPGNQRGVLARKGGPSKWPRTGQYSVDVENFEALALPTLEIQADDDVVYVLDEIGRMELHSAKFQHQVNQLVAKGVRLVGAITAPRYGHRVPFCDQVADIEGVDIYNLTRSNRDQVIGEILENVLTTKIMKK
jgi:nucleoside-triphosphatase